MIKSIYMIVGGIWCPIYIKVACLLVTSFSHNQRLKVKKRREDEEFNIGGACPLGWTTERSKEVTKRHPSFSDGGINPNREN